ncbi:MAG: HAD family hydrolase [Prevotella sp.]
MIKGYIFDYGATLDTGGNHWGKVIWHAYQRYNVPIDEDSYRKAYVFAERKLGSERIIMPDNTFKETLDKKLDIQLAYLNDTGCLSQTPTEQLSLRSLLLDFLYDNVLIETSRSAKVLSELKQKYPLVLVSNFYGNINVVLKEMKLNDYFQDIVESASTGIRKPDPRIFGLGAEALHLPPENIMVVGDSLGKDILPALKTGCQATWIKGEGWTDETIIPPAEVRIITNLAQLLQMI